MSLSDVLEASVLVAVAILLWSLTIQVRHAGHGNRKALLLAAFTTFVCAPFVAAGMLVQAARSKLRGRR
jgi:hypothetical protein